MKRLFFITAAIAAFSFAACHSSGNAATAVEKSFKVWGNCDKCKSAIEKAGQLPGVSSISWNEESNQLVVKMDTTVTSPDSVLKAVANAGYDNERYTASAEAYGQLPECCQYERKLTN